MKEWKKNKGAALMAVLVVMAFVGVIGLVITRVTITNISMKEVEQSTKKNFYSAEEVMDDLKTGLNTMAYDAMKDAYDQMLVHFSAYEETDDGAYGSFRRQYVENLAEELCNNTEYGSNSSFADITDGTPLYTTAHYDVEKVREGCMAEDYGDCLITDADDATCTIDYVEGLFTLQNVRVQYTDSRNYQTTITTDITFSTPDVDFKESDVTAYMKYAMVADTQIDLNAAGVSINGNVYAGPDGITQEGNYSGTIDGTTIITRGDITTDGTSGGTLTIGSESSSIWAENVETKADSSTINLYGSAYIADDLDLSAQNSSVNVNGKYYGYNFQKNYAGDSTVKDADWSSAMMINAKNCTLDLSNVDFLMLSGNTFLSRGSAGNTQNQDNAISFGESLSVRSNQLAYYVEGGYLDDSSEPMTQFTTEGLERYESATGVENVTQYLDSVQVTPYYYVDNSTNTEHTNYYLNFKDENSANAFFTAYYESNTANVTGMADVYANDGLVLSDGLVFTFKGDVLHRDADKAWTEENVTIDVTDWSTDGAYWDYSASLAKKYKSLELSLTENMSGIKAEDVRLTDESGEIDKWIDPVSEQIIDVEALEAAIEENGGQAIQVQSTAVEGASVYLTCADNYTIDTSMTKGIVVNIGGDVTVGGGSFEGLIIAGNKVSQTLGSRTVQGGTINFLANSTLNANAELILELFDEDLAREESVFTQYFYGSGNSASSSSAEAAVGGIEMKDFSYYENWTKIGE